MAKDSNVTSVDARLADAAERDEQLELILVLRGKVRRATGGSRWRIRLENGRVLTFRADAIVAVTRVPSDQPRRANG